MKVRFLVLASALCLSACATVNTPLGGSPVAQVATDKAPLQLGEERQSRFARVDRWKISGRLGLQKDGSGFSAGIEWQQARNNFDIRLFDPLGREVALLSGNQRRVTLKTADGQEFTAASAEKLLQEQLGWSFPVQSLFYWVKGLFDPSLVVWRQEYDNAGRLVLLDQGDWHVTFPKYQDLETEYIPRVAILEQKGARIKFLIKDWE